jgi:hypothetical protein
MKSARSAVIDIVGAVFALGGSASATSSSPLNVGSGTVEWRGTFRAGARDAAPAGAPIYSGIPPSS